MIKAEAEKVLECARRKNIICGYHLFGDNDLDWMLNQGVSLIGWHIDTSAIQNFFTDSVSKIKGHKKFAD